METIVLLKDARTLAKPEVTSFEPFALRTLTVPSSSLRRSSAVGCLATPPTISVGFASAAGAAGAGPEPGAGAAAAGAPSGAPAGFPGLGPLGPLSFFCGGFSSAMGWAGYSFVLVTPIVLRGPLRVRAFVLVRWPRTGRLRRWRIPR